MNGGSSLLVSCHLLRTATRTNRSLFLPGMISGNNSTSIAAARYSSHTITEELSHRRSKVTLNTIRTLHKKNIPITALTAHDFPSGIVADRAGIDLALVGDSLAMVELGYDNTNHVTMEEMLSHSRAVARGCKTPFLVADLPFGTYEISPEQALENSIRLVREGNVEGVKLEGGVEMADTIKKITTAGIPVLGHIGLTPQRSASLGGFKVQGRTFTGARKLLHSAQALQDAGCFAIVLEAIPAPVAKVVTQALTIPTIGIGAGNQCSGQVLVQLDMLGSFDKFTPKFVKKYTNAFETNTAAVAEYVREVRQGSFPAEEHTYSMRNEDDVKKLEELAEELDIATKAKSSGI
ncbi:ketopantoate hydroxymethyltransferase-domain-containing protein [Lipomyces tetrasporus]|uniref:3-methyl-2-oxobutanoate hydroxymethyltransferase n=1 Tax=Lipomyces tetrasporus TaxID=54092 RepID=A0AAD7QPC3_9ASCO|nr:ketopantoate hydroxymethyltransferase-domain-containing protein [Lipomyces tetrasporus]KAJ8098745.1 ketopantoate hydroxymethyltransferase-domain-containing protein [Lipomyces tetrasporus]